MNTITLNPNLVSVIWIAILLIIIVIIIKLSDVIRNFRMRRSSGLDRKHVKTMWKEVEMLMGQSSQNAYKLALLEADKILDYVMKKKMFAGTTMGERLKYAVYKYPDLKPVWRAHILRNKIAHETAFTVSSGQARDAIKEFKNALVRLGAL